MFLCTMYNTNYKQSTISLLKKLVSVTLYLQTFAHTSTLWTQMTIYGGELFIGKFQFISNDI